MTSPWHVDDDSVIYVFVEKAIHGLFPLKRRPKRPIFGKFAGRPILRRQTCSTVC